MAAKRDSVDLGGASAVGDGSEVAPVAGAPFPPAAPAIPEQLVRSREANRMGPAHPAHWQHAEWLDERGLDDSWDEVWLRQHPIG